MSSPTGQRIHLTCVDGPLEGTYEFNEHDTPTGDSKRIQAMGIPWVTSGGQVGNSCVMTRPEDLERARTEGFSGRIKPIYYQITKREEKGDVLHLEATFHEEKPSKNESAPSATELLG